jgi:hypothetical protein
MRHHAELRYRGTLSKRELKLLVAEFRAVGLDVTVHQDRPRRSLADVAWLALVMVPLKPFFEEIAKDVAADSYRKFRTLVAKVIHRDSRASSEPKILLLEDAQSCVQVVLESDLPEEAYQQLLVFDFTSVQLGPLHYDRYLRRWRSEVDEAAAPAVA